MKTPFARGLCGLSLSLLLLLPAVSAPAQQAEPGTGQIELHLEEALALRAFDLDETALGEELEAEPESSASTISLAELREEAWTMAQETEAEPTSEMKRKEKRGFTGWLKKYWWVPAIVAVAVGVTIADDDDKGETEDD